MHYQTAGTDWLYGRQLEQQIRILSSEHIKRVLKNSGPFFLRVPIFDISDLILISVLTFLSFIPVNCF